MLQKLRKSEIIKIGERFELNVQKKMRKDEFVRKITEHRVDENVFNMRGATEGNSKNDTKASGIRDG